MSKATPLSQFPVTPETGECSCRLVGALGDCIGFSTLAVKEGVQGAGRRRAPLQAAGEPKA